MTEHQDRTGSAPNDGPMGAPPGPSAEIDRDAPSGLPPDERESAPLGGSEADPDGEGEPARGAESMPGIPTGGEPPAAS